MARPLALGVLVSGEGTTLEALLEAAVGGRLPARVAIVVADRPHAPAIERARRQGVPTAVVPTHGVGEARWTAELTQALHNTGVDLVILAGYLSILPASWLAHWNGRVINVHPSLLPRHGGRGMYGSRVLAATLASGSSETGATVHLVTEEVDMGPILLQERVVALPGDTVAELRQRLRPVELKLLIEAVRNFADGRWGLPYRPNSTPAAGPSSDGEIEREDRAR